MRLGILGLLGGLGVVALLLTLGAPTALKSTPAIPRPVEGEMPIQLPEPDLLGGVLPPEPKVKVLVPPEGPPARSVDETPSVPEPARGLHPSAEELERMEREGVIVY